MSDTKFTPDSLEVMFEALKEIAEKKGFCIYSLDDKFIEGSHAAYEELADIAIAAIAKAVQP